MNHPDWPAFVAAIVGEPDDDTRRLAAADFLEENGDPDRAAFVRLQVQLARLEQYGQGGSREAEALRKKERAFLGPRSEYPHLWAPEECPELVRADPHRLHFEGVERLTWRRGFVEEVRCPAVEWLRHGGAVRGRNPVRGVWLTECQHATRDAWYAGLDALRGLVWVELRANDLRFEDELATWLRPWLPGTEVTYIPF